MDEKVDKSITGYSIYHIEAKRRKKINPLVEIMSTAIPATLDGGSRLTKA